MRCIVVVIGLLISAAALQAQDHPGEGRQLPVIAQVTAAGLDGWEVVEGQSLRDKESLVLGGKAQAKLLLTAPLGEEFKLQLDYQWVGPNRPSLQWDGRVWSLPGGGGENSVTVLCSRRGGWGSSYYLRYDHSNAGNFSSNPLASGSGRIRELTIVAPADCTLTIRRLTLQSSTPLVTDSSGLYIGIGVLAVCLLAVMGFGWMLNRRRGVGASPSGT